MSGQKGRPLSHRETLAFSMVFMLIGLLIILLGLGVIPVDEASFNAPKWIIRLCGMTFFIAGVMVWSGNGSRTNDLMAAVLILIFAVVGGWVALYGGSEDFSGGIPFLSKDSNVSLARIIFGAGSVLCLMISLYAFRIFIRKWRDPEM